jgi:regulator of cell morphogenesis and NO signaling
MNYLKDQTLKSIAIEHHQFIPVLEKYSLDFCCRGAKTLSDACNEKDISVDAVLNELQLSVVGEKPTMPFTQMTAEQLISYILIHHHFYVKNAIPTIYNHLQKVVTKHGDKFPQMQAVLKLFTEVAEELTLHMQKEEQILFPRIKTLYGLTVPENISAGYIDGPVSVMEDEHIKAGDLLYAIRDLTNNYNAPENACTTHRVCIIELKAFEEDLHKHVHLENNILFPMAAIQLAEILNTAAHS